MIDAKQIQEILTQYKKHGWNLRRVLLCEPIEKNAAALFGDSAIIAAHINAAWFSRASFEGREAWELRHLSDTPFALVEVFAITADEDTREEVRRKVETQLGEKASKSVRQKPEAGV